MSPIDRLAELFQRFPGIGPRQARRFVFHILSQDREYADALQRLIGEVRASVRPCAACFRYFPGKNGETLCSICSDGERDPSLLMVVERDSDIGPIEQAKAYQGLYFVFGGTVPLLDQSHIQKTRGSALKAQMDERIKDGLKEVILAFSVNPDGENTARYVESLLETHKTAGQIKLSVLGRGLSTGSELEYADPETIKNALKNRQ